MFEDSPKEDPVFDDKKLLTVTELAKKHGHYREVNPHLGGTPFSAKHLATDMRHGWSHFARFNGDEELKLSDADYLAALEAGHAGKVHEPANKRPKKEAPPVEDALASKKAKKKGGK